LENWEVSAYLQKIAEMLALKGENEYRVRSYTNASRVISRLDADVEELVKEKNLDRLDGIGQALSSKIEEMVLTGRSTLLEQLQEEVPADLLFIFQIEGVGFKTASRLVNHLEIKNLGDLKNAAREGQIRKIPGLGPSLEKSILNCLHEKGSSGSFYHQGISLPLAEVLYKLLQQHERVEKCAIAGDLRRGVEAVSELVLVLKTGLGVESISSILMHTGEVARVEQCCGEILRLDTVLGVPVKIVPAQNEYASELLYYTGSKEHLRRLETRAAQLGILMDLHGLYKGKEKIELAGEQDIYENLEMEYVPPEIREDRGEVEAALKGKLPQLVKEEDIKGDLHVHSSWSDGNSSVEKLVESARARGYEYLAVTDHSISLKIANGLSEKELLNQVEYIKNLHGEYNDFCILTGIEVDILSDGELDYPDEILSELDIVIASIHSGFKQPREQITSRLISAAKHHLVDVIGHPTGRLIGRREPYPVDLEAVMEAAAACGTVMEINASPDRLDLSGENIVNAARKGVSFMIGTDAHGTRGLGDMNYGVKTARRGWLSKEQVLNTFSLPELKKYLDVSY